MVKGRDMSYICNDGGYTSLSNYCDFHSDCADASDEDSCGNLFFLEHFILISNNICI